MRNCDLHGIVAVVTIDAIISFLLLLEFFYVRDL